MSTITFILGAGASKSCGAPLMNTFLDCAGKLMNLGLVNNNINEFNLVFNSIKNLQRVHSKSQLNLNNIESIFTTFEIGKILNKLPGQKADEIPEILRALKVLIFRTLEESISFKTDDHRFIRATKDYNSFVEILKWLITDAKPKNEINIITFNYDIGIDIGILINNMEPYYGFSSEIKEGKIPLYKLHGSINWGKETVSGKIRPFYLQKYISEYISRVAVSNSNINLRIGSKIQEYFKNNQIQVESEPVIIPPSWNKLSYNESISEVWEKASMALEKSEYIFIIGYSLPETDSFFKLLFALGTEGDTLLKKLVVINPDILVKDRFLSFLGPAAKERFEYHEIGIEDSFSIIKQCFD